MSRGTFLELAKKFRTAENRYRSLDAQYVASVRVNGLDRFDLRRKRDRAWHKFCACRKEYCEFIDATKAQVQR